jgi:hypothetical protein
MLKLDYGCRSPHPGNQIILRLYSPFGLYDYNPSYKDYLVSQDEQDKYLKAIAHIKKCGFLEYRTISQCPYPERQHFK